MKSPLTQEIAQADLSMTTQSWMINMQKQTDMLIRISCLVNVCNLQILNINEVRSHFILRNFSKMRVISNKFQKRSKALVNNYVQTNKEVKELYRKIRMKMKKT